jgi:monoamine oxidase
MEQGKSRDQALNELIKKEKLLEFSTRRYLSQDKFEWSPGAINAFGLLENQQARLNNGVVALLREYLTESFSESEEEDKFTQIYGGMDLLPRSFLPYLEDSIWFGTTMEGLSKESHPEEKAVVHYKNVSGFKGEKAQDGKAAVDFAIITVPFPMLRHMDGLNNWNASKRRAILGLNYSESGKILFQCKNRFWETEVEDYPINGGRSQTDLGIRTIYYPTKHHDPKKQTKKAILLASYTWGRDSQRWTHLSHQDRIQYAFKELAKIHPRLKENPDWIEGAYSIMWQNDEFAGGAFALTNPYQEEHDEACWSVDGRFHFAGEHTSLNYHRWIEGAVESGLRAAWEVYMTASKS